LRKELDSPIQEYRTPNMARRSRPFPFDNAKENGT